jgi:hypothetical protein
VVAAPPRGRRAVARNFALICLTHRVLLGIFQPSTFLREAFAGDAAPNAIKMLHGTTTLGFIFQGGVIICVDSRASQGQYVGALSSIHLSCQQGRRPLIFEKLARG